MGRQGKCPAQGGGGSQRGTDGLPMADRGATGFAVCAGVEDAVSGVGEKVG